MRAPEERTYPCGEKECQGIISAVPEFTVQIRTDCNSFSPAVRCPVCGRLYWVSLDDHNAAPVCNRQYQAAFWVNGDLENRPMRSSAEKLSATEGVIQSGTQVDPKHAVEFVRDKLSCILADGHAADCPAIATTPTECICGIAMSEKWLAVAAENSPPEDTGSFIAVNG